MIQKLNYLRPPIREQLWISIENSNIAVFGIRHALYNNLIRKNKTIIYTLRETEPTHQSLDRPLYKLLTPLSFLRIYLLCLRHDVTILTFTLRPLIIGFIISFSTRAKFIPTITGTGPLFTSTHFLYRIARLMYPAILDTAKVVFCHNQVDASILSSLRKNLPIKVTGGSGIQVSNADKTRSVYQFPSDTVKIGLFSRLLVDKGVREYMEATTSLMHQYPDLKGNIFLAGMLWPANLKSNCITLSEIEQWTITGGVFLGQPPDKQKFYADVDILCSASYREGLSNVLLEAADAGCLLVGTDVPGSSDILSNGSGLMFQPQSSSDLRRALEAALFLSPTEQLRHRSTAKKTITNYFSKQKVVSDYLLALNP
jgi:glycosyltransferase involved in cell wall biosynthesis